MMNCKSATQLISRQQDSKLPLNKCIFLRLHLLMCSGCYNYKKQVSFISNALKQTRGH